MLQLELYYSEFKQALSQNNRQSENHCNETHVINYAPNILLSINWNIIY